MAYSQIAQQTFTTGREDGSTRSIQLTFEQDGVAAQSYNVPVYEDAGIVIKEGNSSDSPIKGLKISQAIFTLKGGSEPLIDAIAAAGEREIRVTITDTSTGVEHFKGYVIKGLENRPMFGGHDELTVRCIGSLQDLESIDVASLPVNLTLDELADEIGTALDIDRPLDVYTALHHSGKASTDPLPTELRFNPKIASGYDREAEGNLLQAVSSVLSALGMQLFVSKGRLVLADIWERVNSSAALNKHSDQGGGSYGNSSVDVEVDLDSANIIDDAEYEELLRVQRYVHGHSFYKRDGVSDIISNTNQFVAKESELQYTANLGMVITGDVIRINEVSSPAGSGLTLNADPSQNLSGEFGFFRVEIKDKFSNTSYHYDPASDSWKQGSTKYYFKQSYNFTAGGGAGQFETFSVTDLNLPEVPADVIGELWVYRTNHLITSDPTADINGCEFDRHDVTTTQVDQGEDPTEVTHFWKANSGGILGEVLKASSFLGDEDQYTNQQSFEYDSTGAGAWENTTSWISPTGNGSLGEVVRERVGSVVVGEGDGFTLRFRDLIDIDLLSVGKITDDRAQLRTALPVEIKKDLLHGFVSVEFREVFSSVSTLSENYRFGVAEEASSTSSGASSGGGGGGGSTTLSGLDDTNITGLAAGNALMYDGNVWANRDLVQSDIPNLDAGLITTGQFSDGRISQSSVDQHIFPNGGRQPLGTGDNVEFKQIDGTDLLMFDSAGNGNNTRIFTSSTGNATTTIRGGNYTHKVYFRDSYRSIDPDGSLYALLCGGYSLDAYLQLREYDINAGTISAESKYGASYAIIDGTLTINGTPLFDLNKEQNLSDDAMVNFATGIFSNDVTVAGTSVLVETSIANNASDVAAVTLSQAESLRFLGGSDINTSVAQGTGGVEVMIDFSGTIPNNYVTGGIFEHGTLSPTSPDWNPRIKLNRNGLGDTFVDMRPLTDWADGRYLQSLPSHNHDDRYYTETETDTLLGGKLDVPVSIYPNSSQTAGVTLENGDEIRFLGGGDVVPSVSEGAGYVSIAFTYNEPAGAGENYYVTNGIFVDGTSPNSYSPYITLNRLNIGDTYVDMGPMETWADARYALDSHSHSHFTDTTNPHSVTASQVGAVPASGGTFTGDISLDTSTANIFFAPSGFSGPHGLVFYDDNGTEGIQGYYRTAPQSFAFEYNGTKLLEVEKNGNITISGTSYASNHAESASDLRLKSNLQGLDPLAIAAHANVYMYNKMGRATPEIGLIAQDMQAAHPALVGSMSHPKFDGQVLTLSAQSIASVALAGVRKINEKSGKQTALISQLRSRVAELELQLKALEG